MTSSLYFFYTRLRKEEKLLFQAAEDLGIPFEAVNVRDLTFPDHLNLKGKDVAVCRCVSHVQNLALARVLESKGVRTVNNSRVMDLCGDKIATAALFLEKNIPQPDFKVAFSPEGAVEAAEKMGFPVVFKPATGSWGRLLAKVNDIETAEAIAEHKSFLGPHHQVFFIQKYIEKKGYDLRATIIGGKAVSLIKRISDHWITNTARGASAEGMELGEDLKKFIGEIAQATGGDFLALDLFESDDGWLVNEINGQPEFRNSIHTTGVDIPTMIVEYAWQLTKNR
jgi:[lysine-biosynthesis-protein LysW]--L-2-aminoadipate ligase